jgi:chromosomal replication initiator protein
MNPHLTAESNLSLLWNRCLATIETRIQRQSYITWFKPTRLIHLAPDQAIVEVSSHFFSDWLEEHYLELIKNTLYEQTGQTCEVAFSVSSEKPVPEPPLFSDALQEQASSPSVAVFHLNPRYTFDTFIVGDSNEFTYTAAQAVAKSPGKTSFNPLVVHGGVGLGKTHLLQAIGHYCVHHTSAKNVVYVSSEKFVSDFIQSIKNKDTTDFVRTYRTADVLLVDDIQFFPQSESTQKEFFHTFNTLHQNGKQIVLSSDCPPNRLKGLEERLISRFQWGLVTGIEKPDLETRMAILKKKAENEGLNLEDGIARLIATQVDTNIRELEGILTHLLAQASLKNTPITQELVLSLLDHNVKPTQNRLTIDHIQRITARHFSISEDLLISKTRKQEVAVARQVAMYLCRKMTSSSLETIGLHFGGRDHSTVIHACQSVESRLLTEPSFAHRLHRLTQDIHTSSLS